MGAASGGGTLFKFTLPPANALNIAGTNGVLNGAGFQPGISGGSWMTISGTNLSSQTDTWNNSIVNGAPPIMLDGGSLFVGGQPAYIEYVSATQINAVAPKPATVYGVALAPGYAGLYQVAIQIPASLANGDYPVVATIGGVASPSTTLITVQQ